MLTHLVIENLALVDRIELEFGPGLNVLTGETGAGKSILINALSLVLGGRAQTDVVRTGESEASVEAMFDVPASSELARRLEGRGIEVRDGVLLVRRIVSRSGRGRVLLNGQMATVSMLGDILKGAVDVTSQHEHVSLLEPDMHLGVVDAFGELTPLVRRVSAAHEEVVGYRAAIEGLDLDEAEKARREDYLGFALDEIREVDPKAGEVEALDAERKRLRSVTDLVEGVRRAESVLYSEDGAVVEAVGRIQRELVRLAALDDRLAALSGSAAGVLAELEELSLGLGRYQTALEADPERLSVVEDRMELLKKLARKHGGSIEAVLAARDAMAEELEGLEHEEARRADLGSALEAALEVRAELSLELSAARQRVVRGLAKAITTELAALSMEKTKLLVELTPLAEPGPRGAEGAEILISPNPGEPPRPLRKIASGGELARVLLAIKHVLAHRGGVETYVFDEIDVGIGGAVADVLGAKLREVARSTQIFCVTHLPQVAAYADRHFRVMKREQDGRTVTEVEAMAESARVEELARMLGGVTITARTRGLAEEMRSRSRPETGPKRGAKESSPPTKKGRAKAEQR